jgi:uncharacterized membrane protein
MRGPKRCDTSFGPRNVFYLFILFILLTHLYYRFYLWIVRWPNDTTPGNDGIGGPKRHVGPRYVIYLFILFILLTHNYRFYLRVVRWPNNTTPGYDGMRGPKRRDQGAGDNQNGPASTTITITAAGFGGDRTMPAHRLVLMYICFLFLLFILLPSVIPYVKCFKINLHCSCKKKTTL